MSFRFENKPFESASLILFTNFFNWGVIEGSFARTKTSLSDFSFLQGTIGGCLKMCLVWAIFYGISDPFIDFPRHFTPLSLTDVSLLKL